MTAQGIGASVLRREDDRFLQGRGLFLADLEMPDMLDVAFLRSPIAHGLLRGVTVPPRSDLKVFTSADMTGVSPMRARSLLPGHRHADYPVMAIGKVRFVGEIIAACLGDTRAGAEDVAEMLVPELEALPIVANVDVARAPDAPLVHEAWQTNVALTTLFDSGVDSQIEDAPVRVSRRLDLSRQAMVPLEGKGACAYLDHRQDQLVVYSSTQSPHLIRTALCNCLGLDQARVRVIAPDVGGGFGYKAVLHPEEVIVAWLALRLERPVRWIEDRFEHLTAGANAREHRYAIDVYSDRRGRILAVDAELVTDAGAYSIWPHTNGFDAAQAAGILPGPYHLPAYRMRTATVATNKPPLAPYRAVARPSACFAIEMMMDAVADAVGRSPVDVRLDNLVTAAQMPYLSVTNKRYDSGDYPACLRRARELIERAGEKSQQADPHKRIGVGYSIYTEHTAVSTATIAPIGIEMIPGFEQAAARLTPDGGLEIRIGVQSHGQGMETTMAQVAHEVLGIPLERIRVVHGDTALTPYSSGTYASRAMVMTGGAIAAACDQLAERLKAIGAHLLQAQTAELQVSSDEIVGPAGSVPVRDAVRLWHFHPEEFPPEIAGQSLEAVGSYRPDRDQAPFAYAAHAARVLVDVEFGTVELVDYVVVDDCGVRVNPMVVDGQILGGTVQGIGTGLFEEVPFDDQAQPLATSFAEYLVPTAAEIPMIRLDHTETPSPHTRFGVKGVGEGGAIAPPAAIANAVNDAIRALGARVTAVPVTPRRIVAAIAIAAGKSRPEGAA